MEITYHEENPSLIASIPLDCFCIAMEKLAGRIGKKRRRSCDSFPKMNHRPLFRSGVLPAPLRDMNEPPAFLTGAVQIQFGPYPYLPIRFDWKEGPVILCNQQPNHTKRHSRLLHYAFIFME